MSSFSYYSLPGFGEKCRQEFGFADACIIGDRMIVTGQSNVAWPLVNDEHVADQLLNQLEWTQTLSRHPPTLRSKSHRRSKTSTTSLYAPLSVRVTLLTTVASQAGDMWWNSTHISLGCRTSAIRPGIPWYVPLNSGVQIISHSSPWWALRVCHFPSIMWNYKSMYG